LEQKKIAKQARHALRDQCLERGGIIVEGPVGMGKTVTCGEINAKPIPITKDSKCLNIWVACQNAFAEKQAEEVGVAIGDKPLTQGRLKMLEHRLSITKTGTVNFTVTPASAGNLLNHEINFHKKFIKLLKDMKVTHINIMFDEVHKIYKGSSNKPMRVAAFREKLREIDIVLVVTGVTATPLFDVKTKDQPRLVIRAGTLLGLKTLEALEENTVKVSADETNAIFAQIRPLQTPAPEAFEVSDNKIPGGEPSQEVKAIMDDAKQILLGNALEPNSHIDRVVAFNACRSKAVVQKVLDDRAIEAVLSAGGVQCKTVVEAEDGSLSLSEEVTTARSNVVIVVDSPTAGKYLMEQLEDRIVNEEDARPMEFFDLTTKDRATFGQNVAAFVHATKTMPTGHAIAIIDPVQLEGSNDFGKNFFTILAVGAFPPHLLKQGAGRLGRAVKMEKGDLVPVDGYKAVQLASKWHTALASALRSKGKEVLPKAAKDLLHDYKEARNRKLKGVFGDSYDVEKPDQLFQRVETTVKQLAKVDAAKHFSPPHDLAKTYMQAVLDKNTKEALLTGAFGKLNADKKTRARAGSVLAKYSPTSNTAPGSDAEAAAADAVMDDVNGAVSDSISNSDSELDE
jgi:hypothetical protein